MSTELPSDDDHNSTNVTAVLSSNCSKPRIRTPETVPESRFHTPGTSRRRQTLASAKATGRSFEEEQVCAYEFFERKKQVFLEQSNPRGKSKTDVPAKDDSNQQSGDNKDNDTLKTARLENGDSATESNCYTETLATTTSQSENMTNKTTSRNKETPEKEPRKIETSKKRVRKPKATLRKEHTNGSESTNKTSNKRSNPSKQDGNKATQKKVKKGVYKGGQLNMTTSKKKTNAKKKQMPK